MENHLNIRQYYEALIKDCSLILNETLSGELENIQGRSHNFIHDYNLWIDMVDSRPECVLYVRAIGEYQFALLALSLGLYRQAFSALRLFMELSLAGVYFSANELELREWLRGDQDIKWAILKDDNNGVFSKRFTRAFFEELEEYCTQYRTIAESVYRECSEYVHGNSFTNIALPSRIEFDKTVFVEWHKKAESVRLIVLFAFCSRYIKSSGEINQNKLESQIIDELGHIPDIRYLFEIDNRGEI